MWWFRLGFDWIVLGLNLSLLGVGNLVGLCFDLGLAFEFGLPVLMYWSAVDWLVL